MPSTPGPERGGIALVLGAGGVAGGAFHAGVLAALHDALGWDPRTASAIVGTSAGSITGVTLRAGLSAPDLFARSLGRSMSPQGEKLMASVGAPMRSSALRAPGPKLPSMGDIALTLARAATRPFAARAPALLAGLLPEGSIGTDWISAAVASLHPDSWSDQTLWICAVRRSDGRLVVFGRDSTPSVSDAVAASCAIPGYFRSVEIDGVAYIDGGVHSPTNADLVRVLEPELVIVSSPMSRAGAPRELASPIRHWSRLVLETEAVRLRRAGIEVVAFQPTPDDVRIMGNAMDPTHRAAITSHIHRSTLRRLARSDTLARLSAIRR